jgi:hypothetical protein
MSGVLVYQRVLATAIAVLLFAALAVSPVAAENPLPDEFDFNDLFFLFGADSLPSAPVIIDFEALPDGPPCQRATRFILAHG